MNNQVKIPQGDEKVTVELTRKELMSLAGESASTATITWKFQLVRSCMTFWRPNKRARGTNC